MDTRSLNDLAVNESGLIFDPHNGDIFTSNATGVMIINSLKEKKGIDAIKMNISALYEIDDETLEKDIFDFLNQLSNCGFRWEAV